VSDDPGPFGRVPDTRLAVYQRADRILAEIDARGGIGAGFCLVDTP